MSRTFLKGLVMSLAFILIAITNSYSQTKTCSGLDPQKVIADCTNLLTQTNLSNQEKLIAFYNRANANFRLKKWDQAIADYTEVLKIKPDFAAAIYNRSVAYARKGEKDKSRQDFNKARSLNQRFDGRSPINFEVPDRQRTRSFQADNQSADILSDLVYGKVRQVYFSTNRKLTTENGKPKFLDEHGEKLQYGVLQVIIENEKGWLQSFWDSLVSVVTFSNPNEREFEFSLMDSEQKFFEELKTCNQDTVSFKKHALLFIHGYNTDFNQAAQTFGLFLSALPFDGCPILFSWPSQGDIEDYFVDRNNAEISAKPFADFIKQYLSKVELPHKHLIAHSMGNYVLVKSLATQTFLDNYKNSGGFAEIIMASADVDEILFKQDMPAIKNILDSKQYGDRRYGLTNLVAENDRALNLSSSSWFNNNRRLGTYDSSKNEKPFIFPGMDTIDMSNLGKICTFCLNHSIFLTNKNASNDLRKLLEAGRRPPHDRNPNLEKVTLEGEKNYWTFNIQ